MEVDMGFDYFFLNFCIAWCTKKIINKQTKTPKDKKAKKKSYHMKATGDVDGSEMLEGHMQSKNVWKVCCFICKTNVQESLHA